MPLWERELPVNVLHFDCFSGISGDMTLAALIDLGADVAKIREILDSFGLPITLEIEAVKRNGLAGTYVNVIAPDQEDYRFLPDVEKILANSAMTASQRDRALSIFRKLAEAEATVHGMPVEKVHFHEVGALDSIADIAGVSVALDLLQIERFTSRSVPPGSGSVQCAHGLMPVPTPATAVLLRGMPIASAPVKGELVTPTGAAILAATVTDFCEQPVMIVRKVGHGAGKRNPIEWPNLLRVFLGSPATADASDQVTVLETNLDDISPEVIGFCFEELLRAGALDVYTSAIQMKKQRPGIMLGVIAPASKVAELESVIFRQTGTFGIRRYAAHRTVLTRESREVATPWGNVRVKIGRRDGWELATPEYEDCARIAREQSIPLREIYAVVNRITTATG